MEGKAFNAEFMKTKTRWKNMKIITVCGSLKFRNEIMKITEEMTLQGNCMLSIVYPTNSGKDTYLRCNPCCGYWSLHRKQHTRWNWVRKSFRKRNYILYGYCRYYVVIICFWNFIFYRLVFCRRIASRQSLHLIRSEMT